MELTKNKPGPKTKAKEQKRKNRSLTLTDDEYNKLRALSAESGDTVPDFIVKKLHLYQERFPGAGVVISNYERLDLEMRRAYTKQADEAAGYRRAWDKNPWTVLDDLEAEYRSARHYLGLLRENVRRHGPQEQCVIARVPGDRIKLVFDLDHTFGQSDQFSYLFKGFCS